MEKILSSVPQDSVLGPLLLKIFMYDMVLILKTISFSGYADDNSLFVVRDNTTNIKVLQEIDENLIKWLLDNQMKLDTDKYQALLNSQRTNTIITGNICINNSSCENLFGINSGYNLKFTNHIEATCKKASSKLETFARLAPYLGISKQNTLMNTFFMSPV